MPTTFSSLPEPVFNHILEFAIDGFTQQLGPHERSLPVEPLQTISLVSKSTHEAVRSIRQTFRGETGPFGLEDGGIIDDEMMAEIIDEVKDYGARLKDFRLRMGDYDERSLSPSPGTGELDDLNIEWDRLFGYMPGLKRLDLTKVPLLSSHLPRILEAASKHCRHLQFLILPRKSDFDSSLGGQKVDKMMEALVGALERWNASGSGGD